MAETKEFPTYIIASAVTGIAMGKMSYSDMQEVYSWLLGQDVWTHELVHEPTFDAVRAEATRQFPRLPTPLEAEKDWQASLQRALAEYGDTLTVEKGAHGRRESPLNTLINMVESGKVVVVEHGGSSAPNKKPRQ